MSAQTNQPLIAGDCTETRVTSERWFFFYNSVWFLHVKTYLRLLLGVDILLSKKSNENMSLAILRCTCLQTKTHVARSTTRGVSDRTIARYYAELNLYVTALYWLIIEPVFVQLNHLSSPNQSQINRAIDFAVCLEIQCRS